jgi:DNA-binding PadR family transcriptional regulator
MTGERSSKPLPVASLHLILALLEGENHGYALMRRVEELSDGAVRMGPGTLYGTLNRLLGDGLIVEVTAEQPEGANGDRRRYYRLTGLGGQVAQTELARLRTLVTRLDGVRPRHLGGATA